MSRACFHFVGSSPSLSSAFGHSFEIANPGLRGHGTAISFWQYVTDAAFGPLKLFGELRNLSGSIHSGASQLLVLVAEFATRKNGVRTNSVSETPRCRLLTQEVG